MSQRRSIPLKRLIWIARVGRSSAYPIIGRHRHLLCKVLLLLAGLMLLATHANANRHSAELVTAAYLTLPLTFEANRRQVPHQTVEFVARGSGFRSLSNKAEPSCN